jgi:hypothetical protein
MGQVEESTRISTLDRGLGNYNQIAQPSPTSQRLVMSPADHLHEDVVAVGFYPSQRLGMSPAIVHARQEAFYVSIPANGWVCRQHGPAIECANGEFLSQPTAGYVASKTQCYKQNVPQVSIPANGWVCRQLPKWSVVRRSSVSIPANGWVCRQPTPK